VTAPALSFAACVVCGSAHVIALKPGTAVERFEQFDFFFAVNRGEPAAAWCMDHWPSRAPMTERE
jgi:hypothetical protein